MNYYILSKEVEPKIVGVKDGGGQLGVDSRLDTIYNDWYNNIFFKLPREDKHNAWKLKLKHETYALKPLEGLVFKKGAKKTDYVGEGLLGLYVNEKLKTILESSHLPNHRFIKTPFIEEKTGKIIDEYWRFVHDLETGEDTIDFEKSEFNFKYHKRNFGEDFYREVNSYEDYMNVFYETGTAPSVSKLVLNENFDKELDFFKFQFLSSNMYVSERLLNKMQEAGITGYSVMTLEKDKMRSEVLGDVHTELIFE
ncbi:hypothetical protein FIC_00903 [Flavobacteriaceae bacterium 3519-10]|nr:hypothetical protein FIC_00903 [Flavobacteriaceae bacterium 3519-10]